MGHEQIRQLDGHSVGRRAVAQVQLVGVPRSFPLTEPAHGLSGSVALITGGTSGIGLEVARRLLAKRARVVITGRDLDRGAAAETQLGPDAMFVAADAGDPDAVERSVKAALGRFQTIDVLVNNAGIALTERLVDTPPADFDRVMAANVRGPYLYARACFRRSRGRAAAWFTSPPMPACVPSRRSAPIRSARQPS
jgi:NAD(P)-dependent dehydrogenase (short-subunit alcohol dehydrogenase family)